MNRPTLFCLGALNLIFISILVIEIYVTTQPVDVTVRAAVKQDISHEETSSSGLDLSDPSESNYSDLVERPMFIKGRKPVEEPIPEEIALATAQKTENVNWELMGIYRTPKGTTAFFSRNNGHFPKDNFRKCKLGDTIDGWLVSDINESGVNLVQGSETKNLPLRKMKPKNVTPTPVLPANTVPAPIPAPQNIDAAALTVQPTTNDTQGAALESEDPSNQ